jgi:hypothetical protein
MGLAAFNRHRAARAQLRAVPGPSPEQRLADLKAKHAAAREEVGKLGQQIADLTASMKATEKSESKSDAKTDAPAPNAKEQRPRR